ncbi:MAG: hypothetical protein ABSB22_10850 [Thermodesulfobacteriota bacterium]
MKQEGVRSTQSLNILLATLEEQREEELLRDEEQAMEDFNLLGGQRIETLILSLVHEEIDQAEYGENPGEDNKREAMEE